MGFKIILWNIDETVSVNDIIPLFQEHGPIMSCKKDGINIFVTMENESDALTAVSDVNNTIIKGTQVKAESLQDYRKKIFQEIMKIKIENLSLNITPYNMRDVFTKYGTVTRAFTVQCPVTGTVTGYVHLLVSQGAQQDFLNALSTIQFIDQTVKAQVLSGPIVQNPLLKGPHILRFSSLRLKSEEDLETSEESISEAAPEVACTETSSTIPTSSLDYYYLRPDIESLFSFLNDNFFNGHLKDVKVFWSRKLAGDAGLCLHDVKKNKWSIILSLPLLRLSTKAELIIALLHEMIHAYNDIILGDQTMEHNELFLENMKKLNKKTGLNITVFFQEDSYDDAFDWYRCKGLCSVYPPQFGIVRSIPGKIPNEEDHWFKVHVKECGGSFEKIRSQEIDIKDSQQSSEKIDCLLCKRNIGKAQYVFHLEDCIMEKFPEPQDVQEVAEKDDFYEIQVIDDNTALILNYSSKYEFLRFCPLCRFLYHKNDIEEHLLTCFFI